jgi:hypothetical protein
MAVPAGFCHQLVIRSEVTRVDVELSANLEEEWTVGSAELQEHFAWTLGLIEIERDSAHPPAHVTLTAEYLDESGGVCFTLVFSSDRNVEGREGPFKPGEVRTLRAGAHYLHPMKKPSRVRLSTFANRFEGSDDGPTRIDSGGTLPVGLAATTLTGKAWERVWLGPELESPSGLFLDLVLARITVNAEGRSEHLEILSAISHSVQSWFEVFIPQQRFQSADGSSVEPGRTAVVLVRATVPVEVIHESTLLPRNSPFVKDYHARALPSHVLPLITIVLMPETKDYWNQRGPGYFKLLGIGSGWTEDNGRHDNTALSPAKSSP